MPAGLGVFEVFEFVGVEWTGGSVLLTRSSLHRKAFRSLGTCSCISSCDVMKRTDDKAILLANSDQSVWTSSVESHQVFFIHLALDDFNRKR